LGISAALVAVSELRASRFMQGRRKNWSTAWGLSLSLTVLTVPGIPNDVVVPKWLCRSAPSQVLDPFQK
jgi:hypothetical protein